jgi:hypothetical protein
VSHIDNHVDAWIFENLRPSVGWESADLGCTRGDCRPPAVNRTYSGATVMERVPFASGRGLLPMTGWWWIGGGQMVSIPFASGRGLLLISLTTATAEALEGFNPLRIGARPPTRHKVVAVGPELLRVSIPFASGHGLLPPRALVI